MELWPMTCDNMVVRERCTRQQWTGAFREMGPKLALFMLDWLMISRDSALG